jgi:DNA (cytosine-5)-methyltransferase 1
MQLTLEIHPSTLNNHSTKKRKKKALELRTLDLFSGIGGVRIGFERNGFNTVFSNDFEPSCKLTSDLNFGEPTLTLGDLTKLDIDSFPEFDLLLGGFPCQAFSVAGYRQGFNDEKGRGNLFFNIARILEKRRPNAFFLENVKNLQGHDKGRTFTIILQTLKELGYHVRYSVLNTMKYGNLPQNRERIYIVGFRDEISAFRFEFPQPTKLTVQFASLLEKEVPKHYYYAGKPLHARLVSDVTSRDTVYQWRRQYVRENKQGVCPTLTANMGTGGHNVPIVLDVNGIRKLTPRECARMQGFPDSYKFAKISDALIYKQIGNSVSVPVVDAIAKQIKIALEN